jgi:hypothetical protein
VVRKWPRSDATGRSSGRATRFRITDEQARRWLGVGTSARGHTGVADRLELETIGESGSKNVPAHPARASFGRTCSATLTLPHLRRAVVARGLLFHRRTATKDPGRHPGCHCRDIFPIVDGIGAAPCSWPPRRANRPGWRDPISRAVDVRPRDAVAPTLTP